MAETIGEVIRSAGLWKSGSSDIKFSISLNFRSIALRRYSARFCLFAEQKPSRIFLATSMTGPSPIRQALLKFCCCFVASVDPCRVVVCRVPTVAGSLLEAESVPSWSQEERPAPDAQQIK